MMKFNLIYYFSSINLFSCHLGIYIGLVIHSPEHDIINKKDIVFRADIDLSGMEREKTHSLNVELEDGAGFINLLLTISGIAGYQPGIDLNWNQTTRADVDKKYV